MQIILVRPRGFCAGVNMAIKALSASIDRFGVPIYVFHEIVHNSWVVKGFQLRGVVFVDSIEDVPIGSRIVFSAHGVSPAIRAAAQKRQLMTIDATCPLVARVHKKVRHYSELGYKIALIGHSNHDEVIGVIGEAPATTILVSCPADVGTLPWQQSDKIVVVTQTTLSIEETKTIIDALRNRFPGIEEPKSGDICYATQNRQKAIRVLANECDALIVVGSPNSSNSRRLAEIGRSMGLYVYLVDGPDDIDVSCFDAKNRILVTAGASAPENIVQCCIQKLQKNFTAQIEERIIVEENMHFLLPSNLWTEQK